MRNNKMDLDKFLDETAVKTETYEFRGKKLTLSELSFGQVGDFTKLAKEVESEDEMEGNKIAMGALLRKGFKEFAELTDEQLNRFSPAALKDLSEAVLKFNGLVTTGEEEEGKA
jgi:hypothetical protein